MLPDIDALADRVKAEFGTADALFANAGINSFALFEATTEELFDQLLRDALVPALIQTKEQREVTLRHGHKGRGMR